MFSADARNRIVEELGICLKTVRTDTVILEFYCICDFIVQVWKDVNDHKKIKTEPVNESALTDYLFSSGKLF